MHKYLSENHEDGLHEQRELKSVTDPKETSRYIGNEPVYSFDINNLIKRGVNC